MQPIRLNIDRADITLGETTIAFSSLNVDTTAAEAGVLGAILAKLGGVSEAKVPQLPAAKPAKGKK